MRSHPHVTPFASWHSRKFKEFSRNPPRQSTRDITPSGETFEHSGVGWSSCAKINQTSLISAVQLKFLFRRFCLWILLVFTLHSPIWRFSLSNCNELESWKLKVELEKVESESIIHVHVDEQNHIPKHTHIQVSHTHTIQYNWQWRTLQIRWGNSPHMQRSGNHRCRCHQHQHQHQRNEPKAWGLLRSGEIGVLALALALVLALVLIVMAMVGLEVEMGSGVS